MRERKGEYFLKIVNEERYQQLFDHPEELRKIITYAKRLMQYEKCFDYSCFISARFQKIPFFADAETCRNKYVVRDFDNKPDKKPYADYHRV